MKRKIISLLLLLFLISAFGAFVATLFISETVATLSNLVSLHRIESLRQNLADSLETVQADLNALKTPRAPALDRVVDNVANLHAAAAACSSCHHDPQTDARIGSLQRMIGSYREALSFYITAAADRQTTGRLKSDAALLGKKISGMVAEMAVLTGERLERTTAAAEARIRSARLILIVTLSVTFLLGTLVAFHLIGSVTRPVESLVRATRAIAAGDLGHRVETDDAAEFRELAGHFNDMSRALRDNYAKLEVEITERKAAIEALRETEERYALAARGANDGLWDWDIRRNRVHYSSRWKSMLGFGEDEIGTSLEDWFGLLHPADREQAETVLSAHLAGQQPHFECEYRIRNKDGAFRWMLARGLAVRDETGRATRIAGSQTDITARKTAEEQLLYDAFHDALTGLPNRALFMDRLEHVIASARRHESYLYAVLFIDLDRFKVINDSMGHNVGDKLLAEVGRRLSTVLRPGDTVARLGGDEFAVLLEDIHGTADAGDVAKRIEEVLAKPFQIDTQEIFSTQSIGIALKSDRYEWPEQILRDADIAMYQAKSNGRGGHEFFDTSMHASIIDRLQLEADLRIAVEHGDGFVLHYQPIMDLINDSLTGFEALVRWNHPTRGTVYPLEFIPLAEETGMIQPLTEWILREACRQLGRWQQQYPADPPLRMSVNVSSKLLLLPGFVGTVEAALADAKLAPESLALEITESVLMERANTALDAMTRLQAMGVRIHIDDFGTGYSSLSYLHNFPVNALKIDRSFIAKMSLGDENREIVKTIVSLAQHLNLEVIAEGVEQSQQLSAILDLDCKLGQGFLFSKPLDAAALEGWIASVRSQHSGLDGTPDATRS